MIIAAVAEANDCVVVTDNERDFAGREIINLLVRLQKERGVTVVTATHDMKMLDASDRVVWITDGRISRIQSRDELHIQVGSIDGKEVV